ncbi:DNA helicase IV [Citrobacter koseri]|nr:DNA helicase IV [Citrobacter koseri]
MVSRRAARESIMEEALLPQVEDFPDAEERRLLYVALTRAGIGSGCYLTKRIRRAFVDDLKHLDVPVARKP